MASRMQIGQGAQQTERAHQEGSSVLDRQQFLGTVGSRDPWHSVQQRPSIWQQVWLHAGYMDEEDPSRVVRFIHGAYNDLL